MTATFDAGSLEAGRIDGAISNGTTVFGSSTPPSLTEFANSNSKDCTDKMVGPFETGDAPVSWRERFRHFTWTWFTSTMSTGGLAVLLADTPHRFRGLNTIGTVVFIFDLVLFTALVGCISARFIMFPGSLKRSLYHPVESLLFPCFWLSIAVIICNIEKYGVPHVGHWLRIVQVVLFWVYCACTFLVAITQYHVLFTGRNHTVSSMTPSWILPVFPVMLAGTLACNIAPYEDAYYAMPMLTAGLTFQGLGMMLSILMYALYIGRLMADGLPEPDLRPGMFIAVGPPSFTAFALIDMAKAVPHDYSYFQTFPTAVETVQTMATFVAIFLWSLSFWFFCISLVACLFAIGQMRFRLTWWSFVFPNVGFTIATITIGEQLQSEGIKWVGSVMTCIIVVVYLCVLFCHARAVYRRKVMYPGRDENIEK